MPRCGTLLITVASRYDRRERYTAHATNNRSPDNLDDAQTEHHQQGVDGSPFPFFLKARLRMLEYFFGLKRSSDYSLFVFDLSW